MKILSERLRQILRQILDPEEEAAPPNHAERREIDRFQTSEARRQVRIAKHADRPRARRSKTRRHPAKSPVTAPLTQAFPMRSAFKGIMPRGAAARLGASS